MPDKNEIIDLQKRTKQNVEARIEKIYSSTKRMREYLSSIHSSHKTDEIVGYLASTHLSKEAQNQSGFTKLIPGKVYRWMMRKIFLPFTVPYIQTVFVQYHEMVEELITDHVYVAALQKERSGNDGKDNLEDRLESLKHEIEEIQQELKNQAVKESL